MKVTVVDPNAEQWTKLGEIEAVEGMVTKTGNVIRDPKPDGCVLVSAAGTRQKANASWTICVTVEEAEKHGFRRDGEALPPVDPPAENSFEAGVLDAGTGGATDEPPPEVEILPLEAVETVEPEALPEARPEEETPAEPQATLNPALFDGEVEVEVEADRLEYDPEGDIAASYSADCLAEGQPLRDPFLHELDGGIVAPYTYVGGNVAYRLWPRAQWPETAPEPRPYETHVADGYIGMLVTYKNQQYVLGGPILKLKEVEP